jgi:hypothetical protein
MATTASEAAKAVNALSSDDQDALLEVLQDYFTKAMIQKMMVMMMKLQVLDSIVLAVLNRNY